MVGSNVSSQMEASKPLEWLASPSKASSRPIFTVVKKCLLKNHLMPRSRYAEGATAKRHSIVIPPLPSPESSMP